MKSLPNSVAPRRDHGNRSGIALVIVLAMLVLLSGIMIAFISSANTENVAAKTSAQGIEARQAAETATNFVIAQIREATKDSGGASTWISQPGAIRTLGKTASSNQVFKLYSSSVMQVAESAYQPSSAEESGLDGSGNAATPVPGYVDLNAPVFVPAPGSTVNTPTYEARYPIVSPYGKYAYTAGTPTVPGKFTTATEPTAATVGKGAVEGFYCGGYKETGANAHKDSDNAAIPLLPMRVKWLYILKDGTIAGTNATGKITGATAGNPPVARTGFWVDDESCKLNINTATEGTYWDTPVVTSLQESGQKDGSENPSSIPPASLNLGMAQPVRCEYQRFPGHPATTSLSPAIRWLFNDTGAGKNYPYPPTAGSADTDFKEAVYRLAPRVKETFGSSTNADSSRGGTYRARGTGATSPLTRTPDSDRLYASLDEYFFRPDRTGRDYPESTSTHADPASGGMGKDVAIPGFTPGNLEKLRFFLTAISRAPDLNAFGKPRVTIWPINKDIKQRTAFDDLFEYCSRVGGTSTGGGTAFNFLRSDPNHPTNDFDLIPRNIALYKYLQAMTKDSMPFLQKSFENKYGMANRDQVLTEIFDYIRCTNLIDTEVGSHGAFTTTRSDGLPVQTSGGDATYPLGYTRFLWKNNEFSDTNFASGQVIPIKIASHHNPSGGDTQGFGRFVSPDEIGFLFCRVPPAGAGDPVKIRAVFLNSMFTPSCGYPGLAERYTVRVKFTPDFKVKDTTKPDPTPLNFPTDSYNVVDVDAYTGPIGRMFMPSRGFANQFLQSLKANNWGTSPKVFQKPNDLPAGGNIDATKYPFFSDVITLGVGATKFGFVGGSLTMEIYSRHPGGAVGGAPHEAQNLVQSITLKFPDNNSGNNMLPVPKPLASNNTATDFKDRLTRGSNRNDLNPGSSTSGYRWIEDGDVIRTMDLGGTIAKGDSRLVAINRSINQPDTTSYTYFAPRGGSAAADPYNDVTKMRVHGLRVGRGGSYNPSPASDSTWEVNDGTLATGTANNRRNDRRAKVPAKIGITPVDGVKMANLNAGDWDRGISKNVDGPFINRADEGNVNFEPGSLGIPYYLGFSGAAEVGPTYFSPNRLMPSAVMFGGLPSRAITDNAIGGDPAAWETLLFRPQAFSIEHRGGSETPADHYLLDLFHIPVVEPYAISEPLSTAGKINLNYVIAPFGYVKPAGSPGGAAYIERKTGLHAILKPVMMLLVPTSAPHYAHAPDDPTQTSTKFRFDIDRTETLKEIQNRIDTKGLFRTASEICEVPLYPVGASGTPSAPSSANAWQGFWNNYSLTGDNGRERPYALIYPRVTTRSNVFTAYIRAQSIRKNPNTPVDVFDETKDQVTGEYRGSTTIERFIDPNDPAIGAYNPSSATSGNLDQYYRFRIVNTKRFSP